MSAADLDRLSWCGTGRRATDLREPPRRERRHRATGLYVVGGTNESATFFPAVRPCDDVVTAYARRSVPEFDARASVTTWIVGEGLKLLDRGERQSIVDSWRVPHRDSRASMIADGGCDVLISGAIVTGAARVALLEWLPLSHTDLAVYEGGLFRECPANALTLLVRPPTIWSTDEAVIAEGLFPRSPEFEPARFEALEQHAHGRLEREHLARLRDAVAKIEAQLPVEGLPLASATVAAGCSVIADDDERCAAIAARQLVRYATSALVAHEAQARERSELSYACAGAIALVSADRAFATVRGLRVLDLEGLDVEGLKSR